MLLMKGVKYASKGIATGIGAASQVRADHKEKKAGEQQDDIKDDSPKEDKEDSSSIDSQDLDTDRAEWALDDAAAELEPPPPAYEDFKDGPPGAADDIAKSFIARHITLKPSHASKALPLPVILPQRRPKTRSRGFVRAYAPLLEEYAGIDQTTFIEFLEDFDKASRASPVFDVINVAALGIGLIPSPITGLTVAVSIAVQLASTTGKEIQSRHRRNGYLDAINEILFMPRGLYCMIMAFKPDNPYDPVVAMDVGASSVALTKSLSRFESQGTDVSDTSAALKKSLSPPKGTVKQRLNQFRGTSGASKGELSLPESAPLIYPAIDAAAVAAAAANEQGRPLTKNQNILKSSSAFLTAYLDSRAQARWSGMHSSSKLATIAPPNPETERFANRFANPNHPVHSGTLMGLVTGGKVDPVAKLRGQHAQRRARRRGIVLSEEEIRNAEMGRGPGRGPIERILQSDVAYMIITNLPSEAELVKTRQEMERMKEQRRGS